MELIYKSTRDKNETAKASEAILRGLATDGGLFVPDEIPALLERGDRRLTGPTMPPQGLYLNRIWYDGAVGEMMTDA